LTEADGREHGASKFLLAAHPADRHEVVLQVLQVKNTAVVRKRQAETWRCVGGQVVMQKLDPATGVQPLKGETDTGVSLAAAKLARFRGLNKSSNVILWTCGNLTDSIHNRKSRRRETKPSKEIGCRPDVPAGNSSRRRMYVAESGSTPWDAIVLTTVASQRA
jgi:hypothetical protein